MENAGGGADEGFFHYIRGEDGLLQHAEIHLIIPAALLHNGPALLPGGEGEHMAEEEIARQDLPHIQGSDGLGEPGMAAVDVGGVLLRGGFAGGAVAGPAGVKAPGGAPDDGAPGGHLLRTGDQLGQVFIKDGDAQAADGIKILQQGPQLFHIKNRDHGKHLPAAGCFFLLLKIYHIPRTKSKKNGRFSISFSFPFPYNKARR